MYAGQYPTTSYYQYPYTTAAAAGVGGYYSHVPPVGATGAVAATTVSGVGPGGEGNMMGGMGNQGAWPEEETERLKKRRKVRQWLVRRGTLGCESAGEWEVEVGFFFLCVLRRSLMVFIRS